MKKILLAAITALLLFSACHKNNNTGETKTSNGVITGMDSRKCACCWGWTVEIDNVTYKFDRVPPGSPIDLNNLNYPVPVNITWRNPQGSCGLPIIDVVSISQ